MISTEKTVIVVSGLPRSGTSLLMQMLRAGGIPLLTDGQREADTDNPNGYFELDAAKRLRSESAWLTRAQGWAVKIVAPVVMHLPAEVPCRILFMERNLDEVIASQRAMLARRNLQPSLPDSALRAAFERQLALTRLHFAGSSGWEVLTLEHSMVIKEPAVAAESIADFLGEHLDLDAMAAVVNPSLHRCREC